MSIEILTKQDLQEFKEGLIQEIKQILLQESLPQKKWLRSKEVRKILSISTGTLQNLRIHNLLPYSKVGGIFYYNEEEIKKLIANKEN